MKRARGRSLLRKIARVVGAQNPAEEPRVATDRGTRGPSLSLDYLLGMTVRRQLTAIVVLFPRHLLIPLNVVAGIACDGILVFGHPGLPRDHFVM